MTLFSPEQINQAGIEAFEEVKAEEKLITSGPMYNILQQAGTRIASVSAMPNLNWEFVLIDGQSTANAFAIPGGKVAVYSGMLPVLQNEGSLAVLRNGALIGVITLKDLLASFSLKMDLNGNELFPSSTSEDELEFPELTNK